MCRGRDGIKTFVATGEQEIRDVMSRARPAGEGCAAEEFGVIGMGEDDEDVLGGGPVVGDGHVWEVEAG